MHGNLHGRRIRGRGREEGWVRRVAGWVLLAGILSGLAAGPALAAAAGPEGGATALDQVLERTWAYTERFHREFSNWVAEESYTQRWNRPDLFLHAEITVRTLRSDVLLVWLSEAGQWALFRDVYEMDGHPVRERAERLQKLFLDSPAGLDAVAAESARYNLGPVRRNFNLPTLVLSFLRRENASRFRFKAAGRDKLDGVELWKVEFTETERPTLITNQGQDMFCRGAAWIEPGTGVIRRTRLFVKGSGAGEPAAEIGVEFQAPEPGGVAMPTAMSERYTYPKSRLGSLAQTITGRAEYSNFRKFRVEAVDSTPKR
jgi:hypothetical protein